jgi:hypothetical protein
MADSGLSPTSDIQRAMINTSQGVIFCLDHTKFGCKSLLPPCD